MESRPVVVIGADGTVVAAAGPLPYALVRARA